MYLRKLLIVLAISCAMIGNSVAMATTFMNQSSRNNEKIVSEDIVVNQNLDSDIRLSVLKNPEDIDAGLIFTIPAAVAFYIAHKPVIDAAIGGTLAVTNKYLEELVQSPEYKSNYKDYLKTFGEGAASSGLASYADPSLGLSVTAGTLLNIAGNTWTLIFNDQDSTSLNPNTIQSLSELVKGGEFSTSADLDHWTEKSNAKAGYSSFGSISYPGVSSDQRFGFVHTGLGANSDQGFMLQTVLPLKSSSAVFNARYNFVTTEFPQFLGSQYNDSFVIKIEDIASGATKVLASFSGSLNTLFDANDPVIQNLPAQFLDMVASGGGQTG